MQACCAMANAGNMVKIGHSQPTEYRRDYCHGLINSMALGHSAEAAAAKIGISARSLYNWQQEIPEFMQAI
jgi:hypothetical protein